MKGTILAVWAVLVVITIAWAHGDEQHVVGTVTKIEGASINVKTNDGTVKTVMVVNDTKFVKNGAGAKLEDLRVGDRVVIHAKAMGDMLHATEVKFGATSKEAARQH
jgi:hypothetical protein